MATGNSILDALSSPLRDLILSAGRPCRLSHKTVLVRAGMVPNNVVFLSSGLASQIVRMSDGKASEVGMLGCESLIGAITILGRSLHHAECVVQISGAGIRVSRQFLLGKFKDSSEFRDIVQQNVQRQMYNSMQLSACNLAHDARARFARWLLTASDRTRLLTLRLTHEFLAEMLGTKRPTVTEVVGTLHHRGLIETKRGSITIIDRPGLEAIACECYEICRATMYDGYSVMTEEPRRMLLRADLTPHTEMERSGVTSLS